MQHTDIHAILGDFNSFHPNLKFTEETEQNNTLHYLDITIHKTPTGVNIAVFRKPTFTDTYSVYFQPPYTAQICNYQIPV